jgi:lipopolysaccharide export system permease protein
LLSGILIGDNKDPFVQLTYIAETGYVAEMENGSFLVLDKGSLQRRMVTSGDVTIVAFDKYAFDLSQMTEESEALFRPSERSMEELFHPGNDRLVQTSPGRFTQELHDRFSSPLYSFVYMLIALAFMGQARTTRQSRTGALLYSVGAVVLVKGLGMTASSAISNNPNLIPLVYIIPVLAIIFYGGAAYGLYVIAIPENIFYKIAVLRRCFINRYFKDGFAAS